MAVLLGTANAILYSSSGPLLRLVRIAELTPITLPSEFRSGPPELPGLSGTSVCIMSGIGRLSTLECPLSMPLTTPTPTELNSRNGLPIAIASCPGLTFRRVGELQRLDVGHVLGVHLQDGQIVRRTGPELLCADFAPVGQPDNELAAGLDDVLIRHHMALVIEEEA